MSQHQKALRLADELMQTHKGHADEGPTSFSEAAHELRAQQARIADLEAQLYAIGAGGVGASIQPQAQPDTAQIPDVRIRTSAPDAPQPPAAQQNPVGYMRWKNGSAEYVSVKRWEVPFDGDWHTIYTAPQPTQQPLTEVMVHDLLVAVCSDGSVPSLQKVKEKAPHIFEFARAIESAHGITGGQ